LPACGKKYRNLFATLEKGKKSKKKKKKKKLQE